MKKIYLFLLSIFLLPTLLSAQTQLTNIPTIYINTDDGKDPTSTEIYQLGKIVIKSSDATENLDVVTEIRGRGNSTWNNSEKKPYRIKLKKKKQIMNNPANAKNWNLIANDLDNTLMRNALGFEISKKVGMPFTSSARFVDLVLNNRYVGNYLLTDHIQVHPDRVAVEEQPIDAVGLPAITGGYLIEVDGFATSEPFWYRTNAGIPITIKSPDDKVLSTEQYNYIKNFTQRFENALFSPNFTDPVRGYRSLVDEASLINWYIACELMGNPDSFWSTYIYKYKDIDKFYFGPLWDFDLAFNNDSRLGDATRKLMREHAHEPKTWITQMWKDDWFKKAVSDRWKQIIADGTLTSSLLKYIDDTKRLTSASVQRNNTLWNKTGYETSVLSLKTYVQQRIAFLTESFSLKSTINASRTDIAFGDIKLSDRSKAVPINISGKYISSNFNLSLVGNDAQSFEISTTSLSSVGGNVFVTFVPDAVKTHSASLRISTPGADDKFVPLSGIGIKDDTGINSEVQSSIHVYPNPVSDRLYIELPQELDIVNISITNIVGNRVYQQTLLNSKKVEVDILGMNLPNGIYVLKVNDSAMKLVIKK